MDPADGETPGGDQRVTEGEAGGPSDQRGDAAATGNATADARAAALSNKEPTGAGDTPHPGARKRSTRAKTKPVRDELGRMVKRDEVLSRDLMDNVAKLSKALSGVDPDKEVLTALGRSVEVGAEEMFSPGWTCTTNSPTGPRTSSRGRNTWNL